VLLWARVFEELSMKPAMENILALDMGSMMFSIPVFHIRDVNGVTAKQQPEVSFQCLEVDVYKLLIT
jgi:hypothetical protein